MSLGLFALMALAACDIAQVETQPSDGDSTYSRQSDTFAPTGRAGARAPSGAAAPAIDGSESETAVENAQGTAIDSGEEKNASATPPAGQAETNDAKSVAGQRDTTPEEPGDSEHRLDLEKLFIDDAPVAQRNLSPALDAALDRARARMREREFFDVRKELLAAAANASTEEDKAAYEEMIRVYALWSQGWNEATMAARSLKSGDTFATWSGPALVEEASDSEIVLRFDGGPERFATATSAMDVRLAAALVIHRAAQTGLGLDAHAAALFLLDREGTLEAARNACTEAAKRGAFIDPLIRELRRRY